MSVRSETSFSPLISETVLQAAQKRGRAERAAAFRSLLAQGSKLFASRHPEHREQIPAATPSVPAGT